ncbi:hypothetical protein HK101_002032 [Irineochytrium annulatum]|nr:hypothetical protein HK101_002032 [Irineochytrium annulatum]
MPANTAPAQSASPSFPGGRLHTASGTNAALEEHGETNAVAKVDRIPLVWRALWCIGCIAVMIAASIAALAFLRWNLSPDPFLSLVMCDGVCLRETRAWWGKDVTVNWDKGDYDIHLFKDRPRPAVPAVLRKNVTLTGAFGAPDVAWPPTWGGVPTMDLYQKEGDMFTFDVELDKGNVPDAHVSIIMFAAGSGVLFDLVVRESGRVDATVPDVKGTLNGPTHALLFYSIAGTENVTATVAAR